MRERRTDADASRTTAPSVGAHGALTNPRPLFHLDWNEEGTSAAPNEEENGVVVTVA